jgi:hypothetical protein
MNMNKTFLIAAAALTLGLAGTNAAKADSYYHGGWHAPCPGDRDWHGGGYYAPPRYYAPPAYYAPRVYYAPAPRYYAPPVVYIRPPVITFGFRP